MLSDHLFFAVAVVTVMLAVTVVTVLAVLVSVAVVMAVMLTAAVMTVTVSATGIITLRLSCVKQTVIVAEISERSENESKNERNEHFGLLGQYLEALGNKICK